MSTFFGLVGLHNLSSGVAWFLLAISLSVAVIGGWLTDSLMEGSSFGIIVNAILLLVGVIITFLIWQYFHLPFYREYGLGFIMAAAVGAISFLLGCAILRRFA